MEKINPGQSRDVTFRIWNNASRIDIFEPHIEFEELTGWSVELLDTFEIAISAGSSSTYTVRISSPSNAQSNDLGPLLVPKAISTRSGDTVVGENWQGIRVNSRYDVSISLLDYPTVLTPHDPYHI